MDLFNGCFGVSSLNVECHCEIACMCTVDMQKAVYRVYARSQGQYVKSASSYDDSHRRRKDRRLLHVYEGYL